MMHQLRSQFNSRSAAVVFSILLAAVLPFASLGAWSEHALATYPALEVMPEIANAAPVRVERFEDFLAKEAAGLAQLLADEEAWARANVPNYPPRPDELAFKAGGDAASLRKNFLRAIRVNPDIPLRYFIQVKPGAAPGPRPRLDYMTISVYEDPYFIKAIDFRGLKLGEKVAPLAVLAAGSDEPDFGHDIAVWENNDSEFGKAYKFGNQPFGNPSLQYSSQAPFHMGFFQESWILYTAAPAIQRTFPEYRIRLYQNLARFAFETGHAYWGYRFLGWGLHYVGDLTMPYHSRVVPNVSPLYLIWVNLKNMLGSSDDYNEVINLVSNRHTTLEAYQRALLTESLKNDPTHPVLEAARDIAGDKSFGDWRDDTPRENITRSAEARSDEIDELLETWMPAQFVSDPDYKFGKNRDLVYGVVLKEKPEAAEPMSKILQDLFREFGAYSRIYVRSAIPKVSE